MVVRGACLHDNVEACTQHALDSLAPCSLARRFIVGLCGRGPAVGGELLHELGEELQRLGNVERRRLVVNIHVPTVL